MDLARFRNPKPNGCGPGKANDRSPERNAGLGVIGEDVSD